MFPLLSFSLPHPGIEQRCGSAQISATLLILRWALCLTRFDLGPPFCSAGYEIKKLRCPPLGGIAARFDFSHPPPFSWALVIIKTSGYVVLFTTRPPSPLPATWVLQPSCAWWLAGSANVTVWADRLATRHSTQCQGVISQVAGNLCWTKLRT